MKLERKKTLQWKQNVYQFNIAKRSSLEGGLLFAFCECSLLFPLQCLLSVLLEFHDTP